MEPAVLVQPGPVTSALARRAASDLPLGRTPLHRMKTRGVGVSCPINQGEQSLQASTRGRTRPSGARVSRAKTEGAQPRFRQDPSRSKSRSWRFRPPSVPPPRATSTRARSEAGPLVASEARDCFRERRKAPVIMNPGRCAAKLAIAPAATAARSPDLPLSAARSAVFSKVSPPFRTADQNTRGLTAPRPPERPASWAGLPVHAPWRARTDSPGWLSNGRHRRERP